MLLFRREVLLARRELEGRVVGFGRQVVRAQVARMHFPEVHFVWPTMLRVDRRLTLGGGTQALEASRRRRSSSGDIFPIASRVSLVGFAATVFAALVLVALVALVFVA